MEPPTHKVLLNVLLEKVVDKRRQVELVGKCCVQPLAVGLHVRPDLNGPFDRDGGEAAVDETVISLGAY
jgi:hypothetical protein